MFPAEKGWGGVGVGRRDLLSVPGLQGQHWVSEGTRAKGQMNVHHHPPQPSHNQARTARFPKLTVSTSSRPAVGVTVAPVAMRWVPRDPILHSARTLPPAASSPFLYRGGSAVPARALSLP